MLLNTFIDRSIRRVVIYLKKTYQVKKKGVGLVEEKQLILHEEGRMDDAVTFARSQDEEARTAGVIRKCTSLFNQFIK